MTRVIAAEPLTREGFAAFGDVIDARGGESYPINRGRAQRFDDLASIEFLGEGARPLISVVSSETTALPLAVSWMERHPLGSQAFIPMQERQLLVTVAPPGELLRAETVRAFVTDGRQGINYHTGTWHAVLAVLDEPGHFAVVDRGGPGDNCEERDLDESVEVRPG
ncbi:MAG TPA: ureidoglycolate lyase [Gammaproteobacteria bacterium]|nr:ureidoglycolate lyase [Gammaproteobacteria bacterium]